MTPKISIIVPVYDVERYLDKCVQSLKAQTFSNIEIILVDDGSPDSCPALCDQYALEDDRIRVVHKENGGLSSARNAGLEVISGDFFMFVDSDDWLDEKACEVAYVNAIEENADIVMFTYTKEFGDYSVENHTFDKNKIIWEGNEVRNFFHRRLFGLINEELARPQDNDLIVSAWAQLFKADKFGDVRFVDTQKIGTEDCWYQILVYYKCQKFVYIDKPYYHYLRINETSLTSKHNPHLLDRWMCLYDIMESFIDNNHLGEKYKIALNNRIALSMIGLGLNEVRGNQSVMKAISGGGKLLENRRLKESVDALDTRLMPLPWKVFFFLCKHKLKIPLAVMLLLMEFARTHRHPTKNDSETEN